MQANIPERVLRPVMGVVALVLIAALWLPGQVLAQGEGARVYLPAPVGTNALSLTYMDMKSNMNFAGNIYVPGAEISSNVYALNYNRYFSVKGRLAEIWLTGIGGDVAGDVRNTVRGDFSSSNSGIADPYAAMRVGLIGAPALDLADFVKTPYGFQMYALAGISLPWGSYNKNTPLNLSTNRWAFRMGLPMAMPLGEKYGSTWLEINPNMYVYGDNDEPFRADIRSQDNLYVLENHLSHNFTTKFWGSLDLRYQYGGETTTDGVSDDNKVNTWGGGATLGYSFNRTWSGFVSYGQVLNSGDGVELDMWRARLIFVY
jgi:hypothetical protein